MSKKSSIVARGDHSALSAKHNTGSIVIEAENLHLWGGFSVSSIDGSASGKKIIRAQGRGVARTVFRGSAGTYSLTLDAYDENDGNGYLAVWVNGKNVSSTVLNKNLGSHLPDSRSRFKIVIDNLKLSPGDVVDIVGQSDRHEFTSLDKITFTPKPATLPPVQITSNGGGDSAVINLNEGILAVTDLEVNVGDRNVVYSINAGADRDLFNINSATGELSFKTAPDWEAPLDTDRNNVYEVNVVAAGATSGDGQFLSIIVRDVNNPDPTPPAQLEIISNNTGAPNNSFSLVQVKENTTFVTDVNVRGSEAGVVYSLNDGADKDFFTIDPSTGVLSFKSPPDWEKPMDRALGSAVAGDNNYEVNVLAVRGNQSDSQFLTVQVTDVDESTPTRPVSVYLMAGQSNLVGEALAADLNPQYATPFPQAQIWSRPSSSFKALVPGYDGQTVNVGPEFSFGRRIVERSNENVYIVKYGLGSTTLENDWKPNSGAQYNAFKQTVDAALANLTANGIAYEVDGLVWMQGESDTYNDAYAPKYKDNLTNFIGTVRGLYGADLDVAIGLIRNDLPTSRTNLDLVRNAQRAVVGADPRSFLVDTDALGLGSNVLKPDGVHYNANGQVLLGNAFANALPV
jgi:hypothetical protein